MTTALQNHLIDLVKASYKPQTELAHAAGLSQKHLSQMLTGKVEGSLSAWSRLLDAASVNLPGEDPAEIYPSGALFRPGQERSE